MSSSYVDLPLPSAMPLAGVFVVDDTCIDCRLCNDLAPDHFDQDVDNDVHFVCRQPETNDELDAVLDAHSSCPSESIRYVKAAEE
mgnify:CR=1 FL=1